MFLTSARIAELKHKIAGSYRGLWRIVKENADGHPGRMSFPRIDNETEMRTAGEPLFGVSTIPSRYDWLPHTEEPPQARGVRVLSPASLRFPVSGKTLAGTVEAARACVIVAVLHAGSTGPPAGARLQTAGSSRVTLTTGRRRVEFAIPGRRVTIGLL
jgi:hypothetical protein